MLFFFFLFFDQPLARAQPAADTNVQRETTRGKYRGVKRSGIRSRWCEGGFHQPRIYRLSRHLKVHVNPAVCTNVHEQPSDLLKPQSRVMLRGLGCWRGGEQGGGGCRPLYHSQSGVPTTLHWDESPQDSTWHEDVLLFMSSKKEKEQNLKRGHQIFNRRMANIIKWPIIMPLWLRY